MKVMIENIKKTKGNWHAVFDVVISFEGDRSIRLGCCGVEVCEGNTFLRLPTKLRKGTNEAYQLNFFDKKTWQDIIAEVEREFEGAALV